MKKITITINKKTAVMLSSALIIAFIAGGFILVRAAFIEPTFAPSASDQDFPENILGANNADNDFNSNLVTASSTGSIIERLQYIQTMCVD